MSKGTLQKEGRRLIDCAWFDTKEGIIGIVAYLQIEGSKLKASIGMAYGENEAVDGVNIMSYGAPFPILAALKLFGDEMNEKVLVKQCELHSCVAELMKSCEHNIEHPCWKRYSSECKTEILQAKS